MGKSSLYRADRLRGIMAARKVTTTKLSEETGLGHTTIIALRKGKDTRVSTLRKVSRVLRVPLSYFFQGDEGYEIFQRQRNAERT